MQQFKVKFEKPYEYRTMEECKKPSSEVIVMIGTVIDRYSGIITVNQNAPSGKGGTINLSEYKMNADFYLIRGNDDQTYRIQSSNVTIVV